MISALKNGSYLAISQVEDLEWKIEVEHRKEFKRFLLEIPGDFLAVAVDPDKKKLITGHLRRLYGKQPNDADVETVLSRVTNLAAMVGVGRENFENKAGQNKFKADHWKNEKRCTYCGEKFTDFASVSLDHIVPLSLGGAEAESNWQLTCKLCNAQKRNFWGVADMSRALGIVHITSGFFSVGVTGIIDDLVSPGNPTRYWVFERDERKCVECGVLGLDEKLFVGLKEPHFVPVIDNLVAYCADCAKAAKTHVCR